ncbi:hypothetical protein V5O48_012691 [Marasmius crinis-equi]|uniref:Uncharacterized protein n=1 Tax=Marasmius crinis-equi TaxID=585013 RepID=A0ABR3F257_9AGAR
MCFLSDPDFLKALLKWWNTEDHRDALFKKKHTKKVANPKEIRVIPNSILDMIEVKHKRKAQARPTFLAAAAEDPPPTSSNTKNNDEETPAADANATHATDDEDDIFSNTTNATQFVLGTSQGPSNATSAADAIRLSSVNFTLPTLHRQPSKSSKKYRKSAATQIINDNNDDSDNDKKEEGQPNPKGKKPPY